MSCWMSNEQKLCEMKILQLQSMSNAMRCIDQRFAFKNSVISFLALIFNLSNLRTTILLWKKRFPVAKHVKLYTIFFCSLTRICALLIKVSWSESGGSSSIPAGCWNPLQPSAILLGTEPALHWHAHFLYCWALYNFSFLDFVSCDFALTGCSLWTWTSNFHCFGALGVGPRALTWPRVRAWSMGVIIAIVEPRSKVTKVHGLSLSLNFRKLKILKKRRPY